MSTGISVTQLQTAWRPCQRNRLQKRGHRQVLYEALKSMLSAQGYSLEAVYAPPFDAKYASLWW